LCTQAAFEQTLKDGVHCAVENTHMRERMREEILKRRQSAAQAHMQTMIGEAGLEPNYKLQIRVNRQPGR